MTRCQSCGHLVRRLPFHLLRRDFETALAVLQTTPERVARRSAISGTALVTGARERFLLAYFLWERGGHESDIGELLDRDRTSVIYAIRKIKAELKSSTGLWWRTVLDRMKAHADKEKTAA